MTATSQRMRVGVGVALVVVAIVGNLVLYTSAAATKPVLQVVRDVPAGAQLSSDDLRQVEVGALDPSIRVLDGATLGAVVGMYARTRIVSGSLVVDQLLQQQPLVAKGSAVVALPLPAGEIPSGLRERSVVDIVLSPDRQTVERVTADIRSGLAPVGVDPDDLLPPTVIITGVVAALPSVDNSVTGEHSISIEVAHDDAYLVVAHPAPRVVLLPSEEPTGG